MNLTTIDKLEKIGWYFWMSLTFAPDSEVCYFDGVNLYYYDSEDGEWNVNRIDSFPPHTGLSSVFSFLGDNIFSWGSPSNPKHFANGRGK